VVLAAYAGTVHWKVPAAATVALFGVVGFATVPPLQMLVLKAADGAPAMASAANIGAFNLGNALGAWLGGLAIDGGLGYDAPNWIGALLAAGGLAIAVLSGQREGAAATGSAGRKRFVSGDVSPSYRLPSYRLPDH